MAEEKVQRPSARYNIPPKYGDIFLAAKTGNIAAVKEFVEQDESGVKKTSDGGFRRRTAFSIACEHKRYEVAEYLLDHGADPERDSEEQKIIMTPLHWAAQEGHVEVKTPLSVAAEKGMLAAVEVLLGDALVDPALAIDSQQTPLYLAAQEGHEGVVQLPAPRTLDDANYIHKKPLMAATSGGHLGVVSWLLEQPQVNPVSRDLEGATALWYALLHDHSDIARLLIPRDNISLHLLVAHQPRFKVRFDGFIPVPQPTPAQDEFGAPDFSEAKALLNLGYDVDTKNDAGITALQSEVRKKRLGSINFLVNEHASMEGISADEWRALLDTPEADKAALLITTTSVRVMTADGVNRFAANGETELVEIYTGEKGCCMPSTLAFPALLLTIYRITGKNVSWDDIYQNVFCNFVIPDHLWETGTTKLYIYNNNAKMTAAVSIFFSLPVEADASQDDLGMRLKSEIKLAWRNNRFSQEPMFYLSSFPDGWAPYAEFEIQIMRKIAEAWKSACREARHELGDIRDSQLRSEGSNPELMNRIAKLAKKFSFYRVELEKQLIDACAFLTVYDSIDNRYTTRIQYLLETEWEQNIGDELEKLEQSVRDVLQIVGYMMFSLVCRNVMLLTYVSIFYLPLAYCAALWAIPNITTASVKIPFIKTSVAVAAITLLVALNVESILALIIWGYDKVRDKIMKAMQEDSESWGKKGNDLKFLHPRSKTRSEWWLCWYPLVLGWRWLRTRSTSTTPAGESNPSSDNAVSPTPQLLAV
ncbi:hypothetical protein MY8738_009753 [Beauveria namnaoensis]